MKKMLALVIALMLFTVPALAESTTLSYTHPHQGFTLEYPATWLAVDSTNVDPYIALYNNGNMSFTGTNALTLTQMKPQITAMDIVVLIDPYANNVVITSADVGMELTNELFQALMVPALLDQIKAQNPGIEMTDEGSLVEIGDRTFISVSGNYSISGIQAEIMQLYYLEGTTMYVFNLTATSVLGDEYMEQFAYDSIDVLTSFNSGK